MKNTYKQLSCEERDKIAVLRAKGLPLVEIARIIGRNKSTVSRELQRNSALVYDVYLPHKADRRAKERKCKENKDKLIVVILPDTGERYLSTELFQ